MLTVSVQRQIWSLGSSGMIDGITKEEEEGDWRFSSGPKLVMNVMCHIGGRWKVLVSYLIFKNHCVYHWHIPRTFPGGHPKLIQVNKSRGKMQKK